MTIPEQIKASEARHLKFAMSHPDAYERWVNKRSVIVKVKVTRFGIVHYVDHPLYYIGANMLFGMDGSVKPQPMSAFKWWEDEE